MPRILVVTYGGGHVNMLIPIILQLQEKNYQVTVLGLTTAGASLSRAGISYIGFKDLLHYSIDRPKALLLGEKLVGEHSNSSAVPYEESVAYQGICYQELCEQYGEVAAAKLYSQKGRQAFLPVQILKRFMSELQPDLVVATNSPRAERAAIEAAIALGVASLCLVDLFAFQEIRWIGKANYADRVCVLSEYVKKSFTAVGRKESEIVVTGNPVFDNLLAVRERVTLRQLSKSSSPVILWASQPEPKMHPFTGQSGDVLLPRKIESELLKLAQQKPTWQFVFRPHPSENTIYESLPANVRISDKLEDLHNLLSQVDLVVTMTSTVGLEAALVGLPVVSVDLSVITDDAPYSKMGISKGISELGQLQAAIHFCLQNEHKLEQQELPEVGFAVDRVMKEIETLVASTS